MVSSCWRSSRRSREVPLNVAEDAAPEWSADARIKCAHCSASFGVTDLPYTCALEQLPASLSARFVELGRDSTCDVFLRGCFETGTLRRFWKDTAVGYLRKRFSLTDANALVGRGTMFVLSTPQARRLLGKGPTEKGGVLLDVGAGDGAVTAQMATLFDAVIATETSVPMQKALRGRGFATVGGESLEGLEEAAAEDNIKLGPGGTLDCIALFNVLDRCSTPRSLLAELRDRLRPGTGRLLLAVVLPFRPFVESGAGRSQPMELLPLPPNASWERSVSLLWEEVLQPLGFELEAFSRLPYLSDGDMAHPVYALDDVMFVLRRPEGAEA